MVNKQIGVYKQPVIAKQPQEDEQGMLRSKQPLNVSQPVITKPVQPEQSLDPLEIVNPKPFKDVTWQDLEAERLSGGQFNVGQEFFTADTAAREQDVDRLRAFGVGEDLGITQGMLSNLGEGKSLGAVTGEGRLGEAQLQNTKQRLAEQGLQYEYKQDAFKGYRYNPNTGGYDYYDNSPSLIEQAAPALAKTALGSMVTMGLGSVVGGAIGSSITSQSIGKGVASAVVTGATGGDLEDAVVNGLTAGLGEYSKGITEAAKAADAAQAIKTQAEIVDTIKKTVDLSRAIKNEDVLGAVTSGLDLAGLDSPSTYMEEQFRELLPNSELVQRHADSLAKASIKMADKSLQGESFEDAIKSGLVEYAKTGGGLGIDMPDIEGLNISVELHPELRSLIDTITAGASEFNRQHIRPVMDELGTIVEGAKEAASEFNRETIQPFIDTTAGVVREGGRLVDQGVRALPTTIEDWQAVEDAYHTNIEDPLEAMFTSGEPIAEQPSPDFNIPDVDLSLDLGYGSFYDNDPRRKVKQLDLEDLNYIQLINNPLLNSPV